MIKATIYEHGKLQVGMQGFTLSHLNAISKWLELQCPEPFKLVHLGIVAKDWVGVVQIGNFQLEILPKTESSSNEAVWRAALVEMIRYTGRLPSSLTDGNLKPQASLLDLLFTRYIDLCKQLLNAGLIKRYRRVQSNASTVKGRIVFARHIRENIVHQERVFTEYTRYDYSHTANQVLLAALQLVRSLSLNPAVSGPAAQLCIGFPEMEPCANPLAALSRLVEDRKLAPYLPALQLAELILQQQAPSFQPGAPKVFALLIDMNQLFEKYVLKHLQKAALELNVEVHGQKLMDFWTARDGKSNQTRKADILIKMDDRIIVLDTKWKRLNSSNPSHADLNQLYVYSHRYCAQKAWLAYPASDGMSIDLNDEASFWDGRHGGRLFLPILKEQNDGKKVLNRQLGKELLQRLRKALPPPAATISS